MGIYFPICKVIWKKIIKLKGEISGVLFDFIGYKE
jgi:hypothetical protein